jgi:hypothetical protein
MPEPLIAQKVWRRKISAFVSGYLNRNAILGGLEIHRFSEDVLTQLRAPLNSLLPLPPENVVGSTEGAVVDERSA